MMPVSVEPIGPERFRVLCNGRWSECPEAFLAATIRRACEAQFAPAQPKPPSPYLDRPATAWAPPVQKVAEAAKPRKAADRPTQAKLALDLDELVEMM